MSRARDFADLAGSADAGGITGKNLVTNGSMIISQRGDSTGVTSTGYYAADRFQLILSGLGTWSVSKSSIAPDGFANSLKFDCTTANASPAASNYMALYQKMEGQNLQHLQKGTSSAKSVTLSFYVRSNKTGTYNVNLVDNDNSRLVGGTYSINTADTWEYKTVTFVGDTTGALDNDNDNSLRVEWFLGSGSNFTTGTTPTAWEASDNTDRNASGTVNLADTIGNTFYITGVQLEVGQATPFEHRSFGDELRRCQRYYEKSYNHDTVAGTSSAGGFVGSAGAQGNTTAGEMSSGAIQFAVSKRATPTITFYDDGGTSGKCKRINYGVSASDGQGISGSNIGEGSFIGLSYSGATASGLLFHYTADAEL